MAPNAAIFINKTSSSGFRGRSTHEERRMINRQNRSHRKQQTKHNSQTINSSDSDDSQNLPLGTAKQHTARASNPKASKGSTRDEANTTGSKAKQAVVLSLSKATPPGSMVDPFNAWCKPLDGMTVPFLQYYEHVYYHTIWRNVKSATKYELDPEYFKVCTPKIVISDCLLNEGRMCSLIANMARNMDHTDNVQLEANSLRLMQSALNLLSLEIRQKAPILDEDILINAYHLCLAASADQDIDTTRVHTRGVRTIVDHILASGKQLKVSIVALLALVDINLSERCMELWPVSSQLKKLDFAKQTDQPLNGSTTVILPKSSFFLPQHAALVNESLSLIVSNCLKFAVQYRLQVSSASQDSALNHYLSIEQRSLSQQIVDADADDNIAKCLLQGLLTWSWLANTDTNKLAATAAERLKEKLFNMPTDSWHGHEAILLWLCITGAMAARSTFTQRFFVRKAIIQQNVLKLDQSEDDEILQRQFLKKFAQDYLWLDQVQDKLLVQIPWKPSTGKGRSA